MDIKTLKLIIESALADGNLSPEERDFIYAKAESGNISKEEADKLIIEVTGQLSSGFTEAEKPKDQFISSGFITHDDDPQETASGFITSEEIDENASGFISMNNNGAQNNGKKTTFFTNVEFLSNRGAMSLIYKARRHNKIIALKRLRPEFRNKKQYVDLFYKEFENANQFVHPHIAQVYDKGIDEEGPYYYMEFIDGKPLSGFIGGTGIKDEEFVRKIILQLCDALSYIHLKQVFHRDLKPDNVLITYKGDNVKLVDFGLSSASYFDDYLKIAGTPKYAAPELMVDATKADACSDVFSAGLILLEMLTGTTDRKALKKVKNNVFYTIIEKCIRPEPDERFSDCKVIYQNLMAAKKTEILPDWQIDNIKEFAKDGKITDAEWNLLRIQAEKNKIDTEVLKAYVDLEVDKAQQKLYERKLRLKEAEVVRIEKEHLQQQKERDAYESRKKAKEKLNLLKTKMGIPIEDEHKTESPKEVTKPISPQTQEKKPFIELNKPKPLSTKRNKGRWIVWLIALAVIISPIIYFRPPAVVYFYDNYIWEPVKDKFNDFFSPRKIRLHKRYVVSQNGLHLRSTKSTEDDDNIIKTYPTGTEVIVYEWTDKWSKVEVDRQRGYMSSNYLSDTQP